MEVNWFELFLPIIEKLIPIVADFILIVVLLIGGWVANWWKKILIDHWIKEIVEDGVMYAQEKYWELNGKQKFEKAKQWILLALEDKGIKVDEEWLEGVIDSIVKQLRAELGKEEWYKD